ncbi:MAG: DUF3883 domain-containing protein [Nostoc sp.]|uniref:DUF3883 domain-containing protein n=1 Tax=Nostoc sp. TaxID=1180 RepID=UPI002FFAA567
MTNNQITTPFSQDDDNLMQQLLQDWRLSEPILMGQYTRVKSKPFGFFNNVKNKDGKLLLYPQRLGKVSVYVHRDDLEEGTYYEFRFCLSSLKERQNKNNRFLIQTDIIQEIIEIDNPRKWLEYLFNNTGSTPKDALDLARALKKIAGDLYTETERFIFEILQNADDFPGDSGIVKTHFVILQEHLLILHDGKHFSQREVEAISSIGDSTKSNDSSKTGYKGIGFKSVFTDADCVYVFSGNYQFRYDKNYYVNPEELPWQIKPIWTDNNELPLEIRKYSDFYTNPVAIALHVGIDKIKEYKERIRELFSEPRFMLFLRHINLIDVSGLSSGLKISLQLNRNYNLSQIVYNGSIKSQWLSKDFEFIVPEDVRNRIQTDQTVPKKLQEAIRTKLSFAAKLDSNKLLSLPSQESVLFTYLPTNVKDYQFPLLVNADFLTTANREGIRKDSDWNGFVFQQIGYYFFEVLAWICNSYPEYKNYITDLIPHQLNSTEKLSTSFNHGLAQGIENIAFIPSDETDKLLKVSEAIIDDTGITEIINLEKIKSILNIQKKFVSSSLKNSHKLQSLGVEIFDFNKLVTLLKRYYYDSLEEYITIIIHLKNKKYGIKIKEIKLPIIWAENGNLIASSYDQPVYFQPLLECKKLLSFDNFAFVYPKLDQDSQQHSDLRDSLLSLGVKDFNPIEVIQERIRKNKYEPITNTINEHVNHIRFIFQYRHQFTDIEYQKFSNLKLLYRIVDKYYPAVASGCYLSDYYQPKYPLESIANNLNEKHNLKFIVSNYCEYEKDITAWRQFLLKINIVKPDGLEIIKNFIIPLIDNYQINNLNTIQIGRFMFSVLYNQTINTEMKHKLSNFLLLTNDGLKRVADCNLSVFYTNAFEASDFLQEFKLPNLVSHEYCINNESPEMWRQFLLNIGVQEINRIELVKKKIALIKDNKELINNSNVLQITTEIFNYYRELSQDDFEKLSEIPTLVKNGQLVPANQCYLSNAYHPKQDLESLFAQTGFYKIISPQYITENNAEAWKQFFLKIQVAEEIRVLRYIQRSSFIFADDLSKAYLRFIKVDYADNYDLENLLEVSDIEDYIQTYNFAYKLWLYLKQNWDRMNLEADSKIWISSYNTRKVSSLFKFLVTQYPSIPCIDKQCRKPSDVYSSSLKDNLINCDLPISAIELTSKIELFLGIKRTLDIKACLQILDNINANFVQERDTKKLVLVYEQLSKIVQTINDEDKVLINQWSKTGKLLACDDQLHSINKLYYIDSALGLPYKRNHRLVKFPESLSNYSAFEYLLSTFNVKKIQNAQGYYDENKVCEILPRLIRARVYYISVYLVNSTIPQLVDEQSKKILIALDKLTISNPSTLYYSIKDIGYEEPFSNFYGSDGIFYVGRWNSRKNTRIGEYLIKALELDEKKISSEKLLDFLDDPLDEIVSYLREGGFDIPDPSPDIEANTTIIPKDSDDNAPAGENQETSSIISSYQKDQGLGNEPEDWGRFGEDQAESFYQRLGYTVSKQPDGTGYDFRCVKANSELFVEIKTINPNYNDVIRITPNEWEKMCKFDNQDKYELLIVIHIGKSVTKMIRIQSAWKTLQEIFSKLSQQPPTYCGYNSNTIEVLIGLQGNSNNSGNDIIFNYKRLADKTTSLSSNIQEI